MAFTNIKTAEQLAAERLAESEESSRNQRTRLLDESDWVVTKHVEQNIPVPTEWQTYRQALRDIPDQTGFPEEIEWPQEPEL